jgi:hypothetical protein
MDHERDKYDIEADEELARLERSPKPVLMTLDWGGAFRIAYAQTIVAVILLIAGWLITSAL